MTAAPEPPQELTYGSAVHLWQKSAGYLCISGQLSDPSFPGSRRVVTGDSDVNKSVSASKWRIVPQRTAPGWRTKFGTPVLVDDEVHLLSCELSVVAHVPDSGYLDSCEQVSGNAILKDEVGSTFDASKVYAGVFVDPDWDRDPGSGVWKLTKDGAQSGDKLLQNDAVSLGNISGSLVAYSEVRKPTESFDSTMAEGNVTYAFTSIATDLLTQRWTLVPVEFSTLNRYAAAGG